MSLPICPERVDVRGNLVLIPGLNNTRAVFDRTVAALPSDVTGIAVDCAALPTVEAIAAALLPTLPNRFWLAGFSFGGYIALAMLQLAPERVEGLALICTAPYADTPAQAQKRRDALEAVRAGNYFAMVDGQAANAFHPDSLDDAALMAERRAMVREYGPQRYLAHVEAALARPDRSALLDGSKPILVVAAEDDKVFPVTTMARVAQGACGANLKVIERAGHLVPMERPKELVAALLPWMAMETAARGAR